MESKTLFVKCQLEIDINSYNALSASVEIFKVKFPGDLGHGDTDDADVEGGYSGPQTEGEENQAPPGRRVKGVTGVGVPGHLKKEM